MIHGWGEAHIFNNYSYLELLLFSKNVQDVETLLMTTLLFLTPNWIPRLNVENTVGIKAEKLNYYDMKPDTEHENINHLMHPNTI